MTLTLRLRVIDETGAPVAGARVEHDETVVTTDPDGVARVPDISSGFDTVRVSHAMPAQTDVVLSLGEGSSGIFDRTVTLRRGAPLRGTVVAPDGSQILEALVEVWTAAGSHYVETEDDGSWCVPAMQAGRYEVRADAAGYARGPAIIGTHDGTTAQDGVVVRMAMGARLFGRVRDAAGRAAEGVGVYTEMQPGDAGHAITDADGQFEIHGLGVGRHHVGAGGWRSSIVMPGDGGALELDIVLPEVERGPTDHHRPAEPSPTARLSGRVVRDGAPVSQFAIVRRGDADYAWISDAAIIHAPDGRFTLSALRAGTCNVRVLAPGSDWASTTTITLAPGSTVDLGDIEVPPGRRIVGSVCNVAGNPIADARVTLGDPSHADDPFADAVAGAFAVTSDADGTFAFDGVHLRDERVRLSASHPVHGASLEQAVSGDTVRLVLVPTGSIDGEVMPYAMMHGGVIVRADAADGGGAVVRVRPSGQFVVENLVPGDYTLELVQRPGWPDCEAHATVRAGERTRVRLSPR